MINVGIIGYGYWGPNLVRNFMLNSNSTVKTIADSRAARLALAESTYPGIKTCNNPDELINDSSIDAIIIATPVFTHYQLAKKALLNGKHVLIEKPITSSSAEAEDLIDLAAKKGLTLMVDHTFLYTGAVQKIKELIDKNSIGELQYFDSTRINLGLFQSDINVLWDLAPHDISILKFLVSQKPYSINAVGKSHTRNGIENVAFMTINYENNFIAHFNCSWTSPVKIRQTLIGGDAKMIVYNDLEPSEKIRVYDTTYTHQSGEDDKKIMVDYRTGDVNIPKVDTQEALRGVIIDFIESIMKNKIPLSNAFLGLEVVKILEASTESIKNKGREILIK